MSATSWLYIVVFLIGVFSILTVMMGFEKILKMIFWNYVVTSIIIALGLFIDFEIKTIISSGTSFLGMWSTELAGLLASGKLTILLASYGILMGLWYKFSRIHISIITDEMKKKWFLLLTVPLCVIGIVLSLLIIVIWPQLTDLWRIYKTIPDSPGIRNFVMRIPLWVILHGLILILIGVKINLARRVETRFTNEYEE